MMRQDDKHKSKRVLALAAGTAAFALLSRQQKAAADFTWSGTAGSWSVTTNWSSAQQTPAYPQSTDTADVLSFTGNGGALTNDLLSSVSTLIFDGVSSYTVAGASALSLNGGGITNNSVFKNITSELLEVIASTSTTFAPNNDGALNFSNTTSTGNGAISVDSGASLTFSNGGAGNVSMAGSLVLATNASLISDGGATNVNAIAGGLSLGGGDTLSVGGGKLTITKALTESGNGSVVSVLSGGTLAFGNTATFSSTSQISIAAGGSLTGTTLIGGSLYDLGYTSLSTAVTLNAGVLSLGSGTTFIDATSLGGASTGVVLGNGTSLVSSGNWTTTGNGSRPPITMAGGGITINGGIFNGVGFQGTASSFVVTGGNTTIGSAPVVSSGFATISGGVISITAGNAFRSTGAGSTISLGSATQNADAELYYSGDTTLFNPFIFSTQADGGTDTLVWAQTSSTDFVTGGTLNGGGTNSYFIIAPGGITQDNTTGNSFQGITEIEGGRLTITTNNEGLTGDLLNSNSAIIVGDSPSDGPTSTLILNAGAGGAPASASLAHPILSGYGTVNTTASTLTMASGSTLKPGGIPGTPGVLTVTGSLSINGGSSFAYDMTGGANSVVAISNTFTFGGTTGNLVNLSLANVTLPPLNTSETYEIVSYATYGAGGDTSTDITDDFNITLNGSGSGLYSSFANVDVTDPTAGTGPGEFDVTITSVPEPASLSLLALGGLGLLGRRRKRRRQPEPEKRMP